MNKRIIIILLAVIVIIVGVGSFLFVSKKPSSTVGVSVFPGGATSTTGTGTGTTQGETQPGETTSAPTEAGALPRLYQLHNNPVAGVGFMETKDKKGAVTSIKARYVERSLGNMFETDLSSYLESRIVNETRPHISEALWGNGGSSVILRFVDDATTNIISSRIVNITSPASVSTSTPSEFLQTEEIYLPDSIPFMATAEDNSNNMFYLKDTNGVLSNYKAVSESKIFNSVFTEWLPQFPNQKLVTLTTRPSANVPGHMFFIDTKTKAVTKVLGNINGLTTLTSHDGKMVLYSETKNSKPELSLYDVSKKLSIPLYLQTLPEKCVWGNRSVTIAYCAVPQTIPAAQYPDQWYQGLISFSDSVWEINATTFTARKVFSPGELGTPALDMIKPVLSSNDTYLLFVNKRDETPWVYSIIEPTPTPTTPTQTTSTSTKSTSVAPSVVTSGMQKLK